LSISLQFQKSSDFLYVGIDEKIPKERDPLSNQTVISKLREEETKKISS